MLPSFEDHAPYIYAAYGLATLTLSGLILAVLWRARAAKARLERLQAQAGAGKE